MNRTFVENGIILSLVPKAVMYMKIHFRPKFQDKRYKNSLMMWAIHLFLDGAAVNHNFFDLVLCRPLVLILFRDDIYPWKEKLIFC